MSNRKIYSATLFIAILIVNGCSLFGNSTMNSRDRNGIGHSYIATEQSIHNFGATNEIALTFFPPAIVITLPLTVLDVAIGAATDTLLLPLDLIGQPEKDERLIFIFKGVGH